ncbi:putative COPI associated protein [Leishmania utingensis]|uniref:COPI associated protein n=1 Tax=Leishmania utingensis TaxID=653362 RepID=A0AAW3AXN9_9TRYP
MFTTHSAQSRAQANQSCWVRNWPRAFLGMSLAVVLLSFVGIILSFIKIIYSPNVVLLNVYCLIFSLLGLSAELRQFSVLRRVVYKWMKYFYFLVYYRARGIFYILFGILLLGNGTIETVGGVVAIVLGVLMLLVGVGVGLPEFEDAAEARRVQEEFQRYYGGGSSSSAAPAAASVPAPASSATNNCGQVETLAVPAGANLYREYNFGDSPLREEPTAISNPKSSANPYEEESGLQREGPNMFAATVTPPVSETRLTRGESESTLKQEFAQAMAKDVEEDLK